MKHPTHDCPVLKKNCIVPRAVKVLEDGTHEYWYMCIFCEYKIEPDEPKEENE